MHPRFLAATEALHSKFEVLQAGRPYVFGELPVRMALSGVYLFSENGRPLYVGRSNGLRARYFLHCRPGSQPNQASFAYKLAREAIGAPKPSYRADEANRKALAATSDFQTAFTAAKARVRQMDYRFVEETDQTCQALLEAYCAIVLQTPYNDFDTH
jgi:hypothetical protein